MVTTVVNNFDVAVRKQLRLMLPRSENAPAKVVFSPIYLESTNLHALNQLGEHFAHYIPIFVLWFCMMAVVWATRSAYRSDYMVGNFVLTRTKKYMWYIINVSITSFFAGLCIALVIDALGVQIKEGVVSLVFLYLFVGLIFGGMINFCFALLSGPGLALILIFLFLQFSASDAIYSAKTMVGNYDGITAVFLFAHAVQLSRTLLIGTALNDRGLHFVVMFIWLVLIWIIGSVLDFYEIGRKASSKIFPGHIKGFYHFTRMV